MGRVKREHWLRVRLTEVEDKKLEADRGKHSRSAYVRLLLRRGLEG